MPTRTLLEFTVLLLENGPPGWSARSHAGTVQTYSGLQTIGLLQLALPGARAVRVIGTTVGKVFLESRSRNAPPCAAWMPAGGAAVHRSAPSPSSGALAGTKGETGSLAGKVSSTASSRLALSLALRRRRSSGVSPCLQSPWPGSLRSVWEWVLIEASDARFTNVMDRWKSARARGDVHARVGDGLAGRTALVRTAGDRQRRQVDAGTALPFRIAAVFLDQGLLAFRQARAEHFEVNVGLLDLRHQLVFFLVYVMFDVFLEHLHARLEHLVARVAAADVVYQPLQAGVLDLRLRNQAAILFVQRALRGRVEELFLYFAVHDQAQADVLGDLGLAARILLCVELLEHGIHLAMVVLEQFDRVAFLAGHVASSVVCVRCAAMGMPRRAG